MRTNIDETIEFPLVINEDLAIELQRFKVLRSEYLQHMQGYREWSEHNRKCLVDHALAIASKLDQQLSWNDV